MEYTKLQLQHLIENNNIYSNMFVIVVGSRAVYHYEMRYDF